MEFARKKSEERASHAEELKRRLLAWPECYYRERDPEVRRQLLEAADEEKLTPEENRIRHELYALRYPENGQVRDTYLKAWMELRFALTQKGGLIFKGDNPRKVTKELDAIGFDRLGEDPLYRSLLYEELYHLGMLYATLCTEDKHYSSFIFGFGTLSEAKLARKIGAEFRDIAVRTIEEFHVGEKYRLWTDALTAAYNDLFPDNAF